MKWHHHSCHICKHCPTFAQIGLLQLQGVIGSPKSSLQVILSTEAVVWNTVTDTIVDEAAPTTLHCSYDQSETIHCMSADYTRILTEVMKISDKITITVEQSSPVAPNLTSKGEQSLPDKCDLIVEATATASQTEQKFITTAKTEQSSCQTLHQTPTEESPDWNDQKTNPWLQ